MTKTREGDAFMPADEYGRSMPKFSVNLLVRNVEDSVKFYRDVVGAECALRGQRFRRAATAGLGLHAACGSHLRSPSAVCAFVGFTAARATGRNAVSGRRSRCHRAACASRGRNNSAACKGFSARLAGCNGGGPRRLHLGTGQTFRRNAKHQLEIRRAGMT